MEVQSDKGVYICVSYNCSPNIKSSDLFDISE